MPELDPLDGGGSDTVFRDVIFLALAGFVAMVLLPKRRPLPNGRIVIAYCM